MLGFDVDLSYCVAWACLGATYLAVVFYQKWQEPALLRCSFREVLANYKPGLLLELHHKYACESRGRCWEIYIPGDPLILGTVDPSVVDYVLVENFKNFEKGPQWRAAFHDLLGNGIFNADGLTWKKHRKVASHEFRASSLRDFMFAVFVEHTDEALRLIAAQVEAGGSLDAQEVFAQYTLESIGKIGFGVTCGAFEGDTSASFGEAFNTATQLSGDRFIDPLWKIKRLLGVGSEARLKVALTQVRAFSQGVIQRRRKEPRAELVSREDLLSRFMLHEEAPPTSAAAGEEPRPALQSAPPGVIAGMSFTDEELHTTTINFVLAGRDTTANLLTWTLFQLCRNPETLASLREEVGTVPVTYAGVSSELHYLRATLTEALRLHPSVPLDFKTAVRDDTLPDGTRVLAGQRVMFVAWSMGRQPGLWEDPLCFRPERFLDDAGTGAFRFPPAAKHPAFLAGPRTCLGKNVAYIGAGVMLASLVQRFDFELAAEEAPLCDTGLTLWIKGGLPVRFKKRRGD